MKIGYNKATADNGKRFILTQKGYDSTPEEVKPTRTVGQDVKEWSAFKDNTVPKSWIEKGYVEEVEA